MYYTVIKHDGECRKHEPQASVFYISRVFSNVRSVLSQCNKWIRLLHLLYNVDYTVNVGRKFRDSSWCPLNRGCPLNYVGARLSAAVWEKSRHSSPGRRVDLKQEQNVEEYTKSLKNSGLNGIRTHDLWDTGVVLYQLSYQANWELLTLWVYNITVDV